MSQEIVYLGAGCFWGVEKLFKKLPGVVSTKVGYSGGDFLNPTYLDVKKATTGHAEVVMVEYDSHKIEYIKILEHFFRLHDPTTVDRQKEDVGSQYRSVIFYTTEEQKNLSLEVIQIIDSRKIFQDKIVTEVVPFQKFYTAEEYHQNYLDKNPDGYICHFLRTDFSL